MPIKYVSFCPMGGECGKNGRRLGSHLTLEEAKEKVVWHLMNSANHDGMSTGDAELLADGVEYLEEQSFDEPEPAKGKGKGKGKGKHKDIDDTWHSSSSSWRSSPYGRGQDQSQIVIASRPQLNPFGDAVAEATRSLARSEASARAAARVARGAALAFDEEAAILSATLKKLQELSESR